MLLGSTCAPAPAPPSLRQTPFSKTFVVAWSKPELGSSCDFNTAAPGWLSQQHTQYTPQVPSRHTLFFGEPDLPGVPKMCIAYFQSGSKDRGKDQASGPAWPTQVSQAWSSHSVQLFRSPVGCGGSLLGPDSSYLNGMGPPFPSSPLCGQAGVSGIVYRPKAPSTGSSLC